MPFRKKENASRGLQRKEKDVLRGQKRDTVGEISPNHAQKPKKQKRQAFADVTFNATNKQPSQEISIKKSSQEQKFSQDSKSQDKNDNGQMQPVVYLDDSLCKKFSRTTTSDDVPSSQESENSSLYQSAISGPSSQADVPDSGREESEEAEDKEVDAPMSGSEATSDAAESSSTGEMAADAASEPDEDAAEPEVVDIDAENRHDPFMAPHFAARIFAYHRERERLTRFAVGDYIREQTAITASMRAVLVDWLVDVQESFELNHETLYLAVKVTDLYLTRSPAAVPRQKLQLVGITALFLACKFDERTPPLIDDFLFICDDAYTRSELIKMEIQVLKALDFELGMPLSYRFLRRYAKALKLEMKVLTLARYILELSLLEYKLVSKSESLIAASALYLALRMTDQYWCRTCIAYSQYSEMDVLPLAKELSDNVVSKRSNKSLKTIINKYSHSAFYEVAKIPLILSDDL